MPKPILQRLTEQLKAKGVPDARQAAIKHLTKCGQLIPGTTKMTAKGIERTNLGAKGRAIDREIQRKPWTKPSQYVYSSKTNKARLK